MDRLPLFCTIHQVHWKLAKSKKCHWVRSDEAPGEVNSLRRAGIMLVIERYRYVILDNDNVLCYEVSH